MVFGGRRFPPKTIENKSTWGIIVVKSNSFVRFSEEIEDIKKPFEIISPLEESHLFLFRQNNNQIVLHLIEYFPKAKFDS